MPQRSDRALIFVAREVVRLDNAVYWGRVDFQTPEALKAAEEALDAALTDLKHLVRGSYSSNGGRPRVESTKRSGSPHKPGDRGRIWRVTPT
jgi:hypothetical protein